MTRLVQPPPALGALMLVSMLFAVTWAALLPAFQAPDEQSHFTYVQSLAERHALPGISDRPFFSTEMSDAIRAVNSDQVAAQQQVKPEWSDRVEDEWLETESRASRSDGGGPGPATDYPPTAYAWQTIGYLVAGGGTIFDALFGVRLMSALWVPITVLGTWLLAGEIFGRRRLLQTAAASVPALLPMFIFISSSATPDGMMYGIWTLALWLGVRCVKLGVPLRDGLAFFALVGLACTVKTTSYALLPAAGLVVIFGVMSRRPWHVPQLLRLAAVVATPLALTLGAWVLIASVENRPAAAQVSQATATSESTNWREFLSYMWQYYLPRTPLQQDYRIPPGGYPLLQVWITQAWAAFGWLEVKFPQWVYRVLGVLTVAVFGAGIAALGRDFKRIDWRTFWFLALAVLALLAGLHWTDYHQLEAGASGFMQGRYMFPVIAIFGLALAGAVSLFSERRRSSIMGLTTAGLLTFHLLSLGLVLDRFYA